MSRRLFFVYFGVKTTQRVVHTKTYDTRRRTKRVSQLGLRLRSSQPGVRLRGCQLGVKLWGGHLGVRLRSGGRDIQSSRCWTGQSRTKTQINDNDGQMNQHFWWP